MDSLVVFSRALPRLNVSGSVAMPSPAALERFLNHLRDALTDGTLVKLTLGKPRAGQDDLQNIFVRPVLLKTGPHYAFVWRYPTRDITKNHPVATALAELRALLTERFFDAHLFTTNQAFQFAAQLDGTARLKTNLPPQPPAPSAPGHDRPKAHVIPAEAPWLYALNVTNEHGKPREGMADKFRQIQKFAELLSHLLAESALPTDRPLTIADMGSGKGYLTFAVAALLGERARIQGVETRPELVELCNRIARAQPFAPYLTFTAGHIADVPVTPCDVLIALHACDTATDDALARGLAAGAQLLLVAPCCQKELRRQLTAPPVFADALRHGIFQERHAEFVTDALRAQLLEWAGYRTKVFEFISTAHTAKNLMIAAHQTAPRGTATDALAGRIRAFARFYGIREQQLAKHLGFDLVAPQ